MQWHYQALIGIGNLRHL